MKLRLRVLGLILTLGLMTGSAVLAGTPSGGTPPIPGGPKCGNNCTPQAWPNAPKACLPLRAERWERKQDMEPCHCPPQDFCPEPVPLQPTDVDFIVTGDAWEASTRNGRWTNSTVVRRTKVIQGEDVPGLGAALANNAINDMDELMALLQPVIKQVFNIPGRDQSQIGHHSYKIEVAITNIALFEDWLNDTLQLPLALAITCCDSPCPAGLVPEIETVTVPVDILIEGTGSPEACEEAEDITADRQEALDEARDAYDEAVEEREEACNPPTGGPGDDCDDANAAELAASEAVAEAQVDLENAESSEEVACDLPENVTQDIDVDILQCKGVGDTQIYVNREGCMIAGTDITMADGSTKHIEALELGDKVMSKTGPVTVQALSKFTQKVEAMFSINDGEAFFTVEHPILTKRGWKSMDPEITSTAKSDTKLVGKLEVGDHIITPDGHIEVKSITKEEVKGGISAYNLKVDGDGSFIANGIYMKSFTQMQMHY
ncbi:MAG: Hint domain-containing protein [Rickettsiales bacterium]|nr:Hint domain-containing protein [Rickettsiales bacterium]